MRKINGLKVVLLTVCGATAIAATGCSNGYIVTFEENGGTEYEILTTDKKGQMIELPTPERFGYVFEGWFLDETLETPVGGDAYVPTKDITFYAKWRAIEFTVTFVSNGGTEYDEITAVAQTVTLPVPEKENHAFLGWYLTEDFTGDAVSGEFFSEESTVTLYAKWEAAEGRVISFDTKGGGTQEDMVDCGGGITLPVPTERYGYVFAGWFEDEDCSGTPLEGTYYATGDNVVLYAGWEEVVYLYVYYGDTNEYDRFNYEPGTVINVEDLEIPQEITVNGVVCSFDYWADETFSPLTSVTLDSHTDIFAIYDEKDVPVKDTFIPNSDGSFTSSYRAGVKVFVDEGQQEGGYSIDITFPKGAGGGVNATFRMKLSGQDYPYTEVGTEYLSAGFFPETGIMQIYRVKDGVLSNFAARIALVDLPESWQEKFNGALVGELVTMNFTVYDYVDGFEIFVDGEKIYTCTDTAVLSQFTGTGFGVRSSTPSTKFANAQFAKFKTVTLQANGGINVSEEVYYAVGKLMAGVPLKENSVFDGWYYDETLMQRVDLNAPNITENTTLYAGYQEAVENVTLYDEGTLIATYGYAGGTLYLPEMSNRANRIFTGWYYDEAYAQPVDAENPMVEGNVLIYAGWRYPKHDSFERNQDWSYSIATGKPDGTLLVGETQYEYTEIKLNFAIVKGTTTGAATLTFRMNVFEDNVVDGTGTYMTFGLNTAATNGKVQIGYSGGAGRWVNIYAVPLTSTPKWNTTLQQAETGSEVAVEMCVRDYGDCIEFFINEELAYTLTDADTLAMFEGIGYGIRSSAKNMTYTPSIAEIPSYELTLIDGNEEETIKYIVGLTQLPELNKQDYIFLGWFLDAECMQAVGEIAQSETLYAGWKLAPYTITLVTNCENTLESVPYESGELSLPVPTTAVANRIFNGWYYDEACMQKVDLENPTVNGNITLYAGWRYPTHTTNMVTHNNNGELSYECKKTVIAVVGETPYSLREEKYTEYSASFDFIKGESASSLFFSFRMTGYADNVTTGAGWHFFSFGIQMSTGKYGFGYVDNGAYVGIVFTEASADNGWYTYFRNGETGEKLTCAITVKDYGTRVECYLNGFLVYTCTDTKLQDDNLQGIGYGIFTKNISNTITYYGFDAKQIEEVES